MKALLSLALLSFALISSSSAASASASYSASAPAGLIPLCDAVADCKAIADNATNAAPALSACARRCATISFPPNTSFLISSIDVSNTSGLTLLFGENAGLYASSDPSQYPVTPFFPPMKMLCWRAIIYGRNVSSFTMTGPTSAVVDGLGWPWWKNYSEGTLEYQRPKLVELVDAQNITFRGMTYRNSPNWHFHPIFARDVQWLGVTVLAPRAVGNTDGIDPDSCVNVLIDSCHVDVGDDGISLKSGWHDITGELMPTANVTIVNTRVLSRNVAVGSACFGGIRDVLMHNSTIGDAHGSAAWAVKIKSHVPRGGVVERIAFVNVSLGKIAPNTYQQPNGGMAISIYQNYGSGHESLLGAHTRDVSDRIAEEQQRFALARGLPPAPPTLITDILFQNVRALGCRWAANPIEGSNVSSITRMTFDNVDFGEVTDSPAYECSLVTETAVVGRVVPPLPPSCL